MIDFSIDICHKWFSIVIDRKSKPYKVSLHTFNNFVMMMFHSLNNKSNLFKLKVSGMCFENWQMQDDTGN